jgi:hypothetical protein
MEGQRVAKTLDMSRTILKAVMTWIVLASTASISARAQSASETAIGARASVAEGVDSTRPRPKAIEYSDAYETRLRIHRIGSYVMLPLFATEYFLGDRLMQQNHADWIKPAHGVVAGGLGVLFAVNTVTGVWNLAESRKDPEGRSRRLLHSALMLAADAGFAYTGLIAGDAKESPEGRTRHKNAALVSMGLATAGTTLMWFW